MGPEKILSFCSALHSLAQDPWPPEEQEKLTKHLESEWLGKKITNQMVHFNLSHLKKYIQIFFSRNPFLLDNKEVADDLFKLKSKFQSFGERFSFESPTRSVAQACKSYFEGNLREMHPNQKYQETDGNRLAIVEIDEDDAKLAKYDGGKKNQFDDLVNPFLRCLEGSNELDSALVVSMQNRKDLMDKEALRFGRLGVHIEIGLPDLSCKKNNFPDLSIPN